MTVYRTGRSVGRTIYMQCGPEPSDADRLIGMMDSRELAAFAVEAMNRMEATPDVRATHPST